MTDTERDVLDSDEAFLEDTIQEITALLIAHVPRSRLWRGEQLIGRLRSYTESDAAFRARCERYEEALERIAEYDVPMGVGSEVVDWLKDRARRALEDDDG